MRLHFSVKSRCAAIGLVCAIALAIPAESRAVTFDFTGVFTAADPHALGGILTAPTGPFPASTISGSFTFDPGTLDANAANATLGQYNGALMNTSFSVTNIFGSPYQFGFNAAGGINAIQVNANATPGNQAYLVSAGVQNIVPSGPIVDGDNYFAREFYITLTKPSTTVFASDALPATPPDLAVFSLFSAATNPNGQFRLVLQSTHGDHTLYGNLTSLTLSAVPIPASAYLFGSGIIGLISLARRRMHATV